MGEDCWSEDATATLIAAWGSRYKDLNRGHLRHKDWHDVAAAVNSLHGRTQKTHRTDVQCKNRIDTIKKKFKSEKSKPSSNWVFFDRLDPLIGSPDLGIALPHRRPNSQKRPAADDGFFRRHFSAQAAAAAAAESDDEGEESVRRLARVIEGFGVMYERVEEEKLRQVVEMEKQRMQFAKDLEVQRMQMFMDTQVQLERVRRGKGHGSDNGEPKF